MKKTKKNKLGIIGRGIRLLLSVFFIVSSLPLSAQTPVKVTEESELKDGHLYTVSYYKKKAKKCFICSKITGNGNLLSFQYSMENGDVTFNLLKKNPLFRVVKKGEEYYLYYIDAQKYLTSEVDQSYIKLNDVGTAFHRETVETPSSYTYKGWVIGGTKTLAFTETIFGAYVKTSPNFKGGTYFPADLYEFEDLANYGNVQLSQDKDLETYTLSDGTVAFYRDFKDGVLNTLILPLDVPNYKKVFGLGTTAYEAQAGSEENVINFKKVADDETLKANTPYLITGVFFSQPYIIPGASLSTDGSNPAEFKVNSNISIVGRYKREEGITGTNVYGLKSSGEVVRLGSSASASVSPYRWYVRTSGSGNAKISISGVETTAIGTVKTAVQPKESAVYSLQGVKIAQGDRPAASLPHGVYIMNGKKIVK